MANLYEQLLDLVEGEMVEGVTLKPCYGYNYPMPESVVQVEEVMRHLDREYDDSYGTQNCPTVTAWSQSWVIITHENDGGLVRVPRNPMAM